MAIIGFYLSRSSCHLAWHEDGQFKDQVYSLQAGETHAGVLVSLIKQFLPHPPKIIATTTGPGSFTSIRIQLSTAIGLKIGYNAEIFCPSTLDVLEYFGDGAIPVIDSFRGDYFVKTNGIVTCLSESELCAIGSKGQCGDLGKATENLAIDLIKYYLENPQLKNLNRPEPCYVRTPEYKTRANFKGRCLMD